MFGSKNKAPTRVGAREKIRQARAAMGQGGPARPKDGKEPSAAAGAAAIFFASVALAFMLTVYYIDEGGLNLSVGIDWLDRLLFKAGTHTFMGTPEVDKGIVILIRGIFIFFAAGMWPFVALVVQRALDNAHMNVYRVFWGTPIGLLLFVLVLKDFFLPLIGQVMQGF